MIKCVFCVTAVFLFSIITFAAPPVNDDLANAQTLSGASGMVSSSTFDATRQAGEPTHWSSGSTVYRMVWFSWTAPETKPTRLFVNFSSNGFDPAMAVYTGSNFPVEGITRNNNASGLFPRLDFAAVAGTTYKIVVGLFNDPNAQGGNFNLQWSQSVNPVNDNFANAQNIEMADGGSLAITNLGATKEAGEPTHIGVSDKSVWLKLRINNIFNDRSLTFSTTPSFEPILDTTLSVYTGSSLANLTPVVKNDNAEVTLRSRVTFLAKAEVDYYIAVDTKAVTAPGNIILNWNISKTKYYTEFDTRNAATGEVFYNDAADIAVFRPANGIWYWLNSGNSTFNAFKFGASGDMPIPADYDGDGRTDHAVTRNENGLKFWYIQNSFGGSFRVLQWGLASDKVVPGDYDYDGRMDIAVFRPSNGGWYILRSSDNQVQSLEFGMKGDIPVLGDFKGTSPGTDIAVFRPSNGTWYILNGNSFIAFPFGQNGDKPVVADYDDDGKSDIAVFRPSGGIWYYIESGNNQFRAVNWGLPDDIPMTGDYDSNGNDLADFAVFRPSAGSWYINKAEGTQFHYQQFGLGSDIPVSSLNLLQQ